MSLQLAKSKSAQDAYALVRDLQDLLVKNLEHLDPQHRSTPFRQFDWLRESGRFGGGSRFMATDEVLFNRASINVSQVQYENEANKALASATAISSIVHPRSPKVPSMHIHISWTEMKLGAGYWRIMGDLNPSIPAAADRDAFLAAFRSAVSSELYHHGVKQGEKYFFIPALGRHRGVAHFYLEQYRSDDAKADYHMARAFGTKVIETYASIVRNILSSQPKVDDQDWRRQLAYHSLYFLQVLTLDRGTTSGLLVHAENDTGILGSLPSHVDKALLTSWIPKLPKLQQGLLQEILEVVPPGEKSLIDDAVKLSLARVIRHFYLQHPEAQDLMARGDLVPPTQDNHLKPVQ